MINATVKLNKRMILALGLLISIIILFLVEFKVVSKKETKLSVDSFEKRIAYISALGYEVGSVEEIESQVFIPNQFPESLEDYNKKQQELGFNLHNFEGKTLTRYTYNCTDNVVVTLFSYNGVLVGVDVGNK